MPGISSGWILTHSSCRCSDVRNTGTSLIMLAMKQNHMMLFQLFVNLSIHINHDGCCRLRCCHCFWRFFVDASILNFSVTSVVASVPGWIFFCARFVTCALLLYIAVFLMTCVCLCVCVSLLATIANSAVQSSTRTLFHNAICS